MFLNAATTVVEATNGAANASTNVVVDSRFKRFKGMTKKLVYDTLLTLILGALLLLSPLPLVTETN